MKARPILEGISTRRREQNGPDGGIDSIDLEICFSPWEVEFKQSFLKPGRKSEESKAIEPNEEEIANDPNEAVKARFTRFMKEHAKYCPAFIKEVDKKLYPTYTEVVQVEMYFMKIYNRLQGSYYRSMSSLMHDIDLLEANARLFNSPTSQLVMQATPLVEYLKLILKRAQEDPESVNNPDRRDVEKLIRQITAFGLQDKKYEFERVVLENAPIGDQPSQNASHLATSQKRLIDEADNQYKTRLRRTQTPARRQGSMRFGSDDEEMKPSSREQRNRASRHSRNFINDESESEDHFSSGADNERGSSWHTSRAERHNSRQKSNGEPPVINGGMKLRHRK